MLTVIWRPQTSPAPRGFTLVEVLVATGIFIVLLGLILTNYRRGTDDSILAKETSLFMSRLRLAQEQSAAGTVAGFCAVQNPDAKCTTDSNCTAMWAATCKVNTPSGGFGIFASCATSAAADNNHWPDPNLGQYYMFADRVQCLGNCFPFVWSGATWDGAALAFKNMDTGTDHLFSSDFDDAKNFFKGDTIAEEFAFDPKVTLLDMQLLETGTNGKVKCINASPWIGATPAHPLGNPPLNYPLQAVVHFPSPDGRRVVISDNVRTTTPNESAFNLSGDKPWKEIRFMLGLKSRSTQDCQRVRVTTEGLITKDTDADCAF